MTYNQQNDGYNNRVNQPLPGSGPTQLEEAYHTGRPTDGLMPATGAVHNQTGLGGGVEKVGIIDKIKNAVIPGHQAQQQQQQQQYGTHNTTNTNVGTYTTPVGAHNTTMPNVGTTGLDHATLNAMFPNGVTDNADVRHKNELVGGSAYPVGQQTHTHGAGHPGIVEKIKDTVTGHTTATHGAGHVHQGHPMTNEGYRAEPVGTVMGTSTYNTTTTTPTGTNHMAGDHVHDGHKPGVMEKIKDAVIPGHKTVDHDHNAIGTVRTPENAGELRHNNMAFPPAMPTGTHGAHNSTAHTTDPVHAGHVANTDYAAPDSNIRAANYDILVSNANTEYANTVTPHTAAVLEHRQGPLAAGVANQGVAHQGVLGTTGAGHHDTVGTHGVEHKQGGIKGLISKVTGH